MRALLISPRPEGFLAVQFPETLALTGKKLVAPPLGLITAAALLPKDWELQLLDLGLHTLGEAHWQWADIILVSGNYLQRSSLLRLVGEAKRRGKPVVAGGPFVSSVPEQVLEAGADFVVRGEAENTVPLFLDALKAGAKQGVFQTDEKPDMSLSPLPRVDLLSDINRYFYMSVQTTRGCPFNCEFCDVIALNGRIPRFKTPARVLEELDAIYRLGWRGPVFMADDNFIGNKPNARAILAAMIQWQEERGEPFSFFTQASVNLGQDTELVDLMTAANFGMVLMGVETPDEDVLTRTRKTQNVRNPLAESIINVTRNGLPVLGTFMLGFDGETKEAGRRIAALVEKTDMPVAMAFTLWAIPHTGLWDRLEQEGRLLKNAARADNVFAGGFNFVPQRPVKEILDEFVDLWDYLYEPSRFLARTYRSYLGMRPTRLAMAEEVSAYRAAVPPQAQRSLRDKMFDLRSFVILLWRMGIRPRYRVQFWRQFIGMMKQNPSRVWQYVCACATGLDMFRFREEFLRLSRSAAHETDSRRPPDTGAVEVAVRRTTLS
jgi:radical SAM superfamily enzyme YgiQ (UPF0313 family)